jgi:hypothetical protein
MTIDNGAATQRARNILLLVIVAGFDTAVALTAYARNQSLGGIFTVGSLVATLLLLWSLLAGNSDRLIRITLLGLVLAYTAFKVFAAVMFMRYG